MYEELGGAFFFDEDEGPVCPICGVDSADVVVTPEQVAAYEKAGNEIKVQGKVRLERPEEANAGEGT